MKVRGKKGERGLLWMETDRVAAVAMQKAKQSIEGGGIGRQKFSAQFPFCPVLISSFYSGRHENSRKINYYLNKKLVEKMDRISRKQRQLERKYDNLRRYAAEEEKYKTTTSTSSSSKTTLSQLSLSQSTTARSSSAKAGTSEGGEQTMEQQSSSTFRGIESSAQGLHRAPSTADARSVSADPIKRYHKDPSGGESLRSYPVVIAIQDYLPEPGKSPEEALPLDQGQIVEVLDNKNPASWLVRTKAQPPQTGWVPGSYFETPSKYYTQRRTTRELMGVGEDVSAQQQALMKREQVYTEMLKTEEEFCMELRLAIDHFVKALESEEAPAEAKDHKAQLALNLPALHNFHANVLLKGLQYYSDDPGKVGQTFVRLERDFEQHVAFMRELESTLRMIQEVHSIGQFLEEIKSKSGQVLRPFTEYLQLIPERVAKYEGFFREIIKYSTRAEQNTDIMQKALELVQSMPKRAKEIEFTKNILNYPGDTRRLGRIYRHELFQVWESDEGEPTEKYVFLFKNKMMLTDRDNRPDPPLFKHYSTIRVDKYTVRQHTVEGETIVFRPNEPGLPTFRMKAKDFESQEFVRKAWIKDIVKMQQTIAAALAADDDSLSLSLAPDMASHLEQQIQQSQMSIPRGETPLQRRESSVLTVVPATPADVDLTTTSRKTSSAQFLGPEEGPPRKKVKSPPGISPTGSSTSLYSGGSSSIEWQTTGTSLEMQGTRVTRTQYGFRTLQESSAKMCLKVTGFPLPDITWYKDSVLIKEDERHTFYSDEDGYFALTIDPVKTDDTGRYTCVATNEYGQASTSAFFRVLKMEKESAPPSFKSQLQEQNCKEGDVVDFECQVDGWPEPEIIWLVDDQPLRPSHDFRIQYDGQLTKLEIRDAQPDDTGTYAVKITNEYGTAESKCRLNVQPDPDKNHVPPEFQAVIEDVDCNEGDTVKFKAILTGDPDPEVIWYVNGVPLSQSEKIKFISEDGICILTIQDVSRHFDGTVTCQGKNRLGSGSCEARLRVRVPPVPPQFERPLEDRLITENGAVMFEVDVIGYPEPKVEFFLKGRPLINGQDGVEIRQLEGNYRVTIQNCQIDKHDGEIMAKAINEHGQAESRARLTVEQEEEESRCAPTFIKDIEDQTVKHGQEATFDTVVRGTPVPAVNWFLNGQKLDAQTPGVVSIQANGIEHKIVLNSANCAGMVLCRAENSIGRFETKARLIVLPAEKQKHAPVFRQPLLDKAETVGASTVFEVTVDAEPAAQFRWTLNGQELRESERIHFREFEGSSKLEMDQCQSEDGGIIECTAINSEGQAVSSAKFTVNRKPKAPEFDKKPGTVQVEKGEQAVFEAHADAMPPPEYQWSIGGRRVFPSTDGARIELNEPAGICRLIIDTNKISESAPIVVNVANNLGSDECSGRLIVVEPLPVPPFKKSRLSEEESSESQITQLQNLPGGEAAKMGEYAGDEGPFGRAEPMEGVEFQQGPPGIPAFKKGLEQVLECQPGEELVAEVKVDGAQKVKWFKDGQPLEDGKNGVRIEENIPEGISRLHIPNIEPGENGRIRVEAENENGKSASEAQIRAGPVPTIKVDEAGPGAPKFEQQLQNANVNEGESVELKTVVTGDPAPSVRWLLNDKVVETGEENVQIGQQPGGVHTLRIDQANPAKHSGRVLAQAENTQGRAESAADISVKSKPGPPYFSREPQDHEVTDEEESVKFSAIVHGDPVPTVYWYLKDEMLVTSDSVRVKHEAGTGKTSIRLVRPKIEDSGEVRVRAENMHGQAQASAKLAVSKKGELPRFLTDMDDRQVNERSNVKFVAKIEGVPEPEVQWTLNGEPIAGDNVRISKEGNAHCLEITGALPSQSGEIACTAKNSAGSKRQNVQLMVKECGFGPTFARNLTDCLVEENQTLVMEAQLSEGAKPKPTVKWLRDGKELAGDDHLKLTESEDGLTHKMTVLRAEPGDKGRITLQAENQFGKAETSASVGVQKRFSQKKPQFLSELGPITITEGDTLTAKVIITGDPKPYTKWYINNQMVYQTEDTEMKDEAGVYTLVIHGCTRDMTGKIKCIAGNKMGEATIEGKLTVVAPVPVEFETGLCDATCREGDTLRLKAVLLGEPMPEVTWFINGKKLVEGQNIKIHADQGTYTVTIKNITQDYSGLVVCEAVNEFGKASSQATLKVLPRGEPPDFLEWLSNVRARQGSEVVHKVVYTGDPRPVISWFINNQQIQSSDEISIVTTENTSTLTIRSFNPEKHVGEIICKAENDAGEVSCTANMASYTSDMFTESESGSQVEEEEKETFRTPTPIMAPAFITKIKDARAQRGHQAIFECVVPDTKGVCCKWLHDGKEIELIARIRVQMQTIEGFTTSELVIDEVEPEDAGKYTVIVANAAGMAECEAKLEVVETLDKPVQKAPEFTVNLADKVVPLREKVTFECKVTGLPEPQITWFKGDQKLEDKPEEGIQITNEKGVQRLVIEAVENVHEGKYVCVAENIVGRAETAGNLRIETMAPEFTRPLSDQQAQVGGQVVLECSVRGIPQPNVEFFTVHDNFRIQSGTRVSIQHDESNTHWRMVIKDVQQNDFRQYRAVAKNEFGQAQTEAKVTEQESGLERPRIIEPLKRQKVKEGETVEMGVKVAGAGRPGQQPPEVEWFKNGEPLQPDGDRVKLVEYRDTGEFKLVIRDARAEDAGEYGIRISNKAGQDSSQAQLAVEMEEMQKPEFTQPLRDTNIKELETSTLAVTVTGIPQPEVQWFKDGQPVQIDGVHLVRQDNPEAGQHSLTINQARVEDAGLFTCKAVNKAGEAESRARFGVQEDLEPPKFTEGLKPMQIKEKETATMSVQVEGKPEPEIHWYKDGRPVQIDQVRIVAKDEEHGRHSLTVNDALLIDAGQYSVKAINKAGQAETEAKFGVQELLEAPKFTEGLKPLEVKEGESATMSVTVSGMPAPEIQWYKDGQPVEIDGVHVARQDDGQGHHSLVIKDAKLRDAGSYTCQAKNKAGQCVTQAKFGVIEDVEMPKFTDGLKPVEIKEGESAQMAVAVEGKPEPQVQWYKDGRPVQIDNVHVVAKDDGQGHHSLMVKDANMADAGTYTCKAVNKEGQAESEAKVGVVEDLVAPEFKKGLEPVEINEGETAKMSVGVEGKPLPQVQWFKDGQPVQIDGTHLVAQDDGHGHHSLTVKDAKLGDAGTYSCKAVNKAGSAETRANFAVIEELEAPKFVDGLKPVEVKEGETAKMSVEVEGKPEPEVSWYKDERPVQMDNEHVVAKEEGKGQHSLTVKDANLADAGTYSAKAVNKVGEAETKANFGVIEDVEAPKFVDGLKPVEVKEGETAKMSVTVEGKPEPQVQWYKDGRPVQIDNVHIVAQDDGQGHHSLTVKDAILGDAGTYTCKAVNKGGQAESEAKFAVIEEVEAPHFIEPLKEQEVHPGQESVDMECTVQGKPEPEVKWTRNGEPIQMDGQHAFAKKDAQGHHTLVIPNPQKADAGVYRCEAVNKAGRDETSAQLKYPTEMEVDQPKEEQVKPMFTRELEPKTVKEGEPVEMSCQVNAKESKPEIRWFRDDKPIQPGQEPNIQIEQSEDGTLRLEILHATKAEVGVYRCEAVNPVGRAETSAPLKYAEQLPIEQPEEEHEALLAWRRPLQDKQVPKGTRGVVLECQLEPGAMRGVRVDWLKDGAILSNKMDQYRLKVEQQSDGTQRLLFDTAEFEHIGVYRCVATDSSGNQIWTEARLGVIAPRDSEEVAPGPPEFVELLKSATTTIGGTVVLRCKVRGNPRPTITWSRQGYGPVTITDRISLEYHEDGTIILTLKNAEMDDTGEYRCDAENEYGTAWTEGPIIVAAEGSLPTEGEAPDFVEPVRPITIKQGETGVLEGKITGLPFPEVKWYKGEQPIVPGENPRYKIESLPDGTQRLIVSNAQMSDMDDYRCEASNKYGDVWSDVTLTVQIPSPEESLVGAPVPPTFVKGLQEVHANEGEPAVLECVVKGEPKPQIKWFKDGQEIEPDNMHFKQTQEPDGTCRLSIPAARITDAGTFRCEAINPSGSARTEGPLRVHLIEEAPMGEEAPMEEAAPALAEEMKPAQAMEGEEAPTPMEVAPMMEAPAFLQDLRPVQAKEGEEAVFECKVGGEPKPDIKWYKDGRELGPEDGVMESMPDGTQRLRLPNVGPDDEGIYECAATNPAGTVRSKAPLSVIPEEKPEAVGKPEIVKGLQPVTVRPGEPAQFEVQVRGPLRTVKWYKNGKEMENPKTEEDGQGCFRLIIPSAGPDDEAEYKVVVANPAGEADSSAPLTLLKPLGFVKGLEDQSVPKGQKAVLEVETNRAPRLVKWYKNGEELKPGQAKAEPKQISDTKFRLEIPDADEEDAADYSVRVFDREDEPGAESSCKLTVLLPAEPKAEQPGFEQPLREQTIPEEDELVLEVKTHGKPHTVKWYKNGEELKPSDRIKMEQIGPDHFRLVIPSAKQDDSGNYAVEIINDAGKAKCDAQQTVEPVPEFIRPLQDVEVAEGERAEFWCETNLRSVPRVVKWFKNGQELRADDRIEIRAEPNGIFRLVIRSAVKEDIGTYKILLENTAGKAESQANLGVRSAAQQPGFEQPLKEQTIPEEDQLVLEVKTFGKPHTVKWYKNGEELKPTERIRMEKLGPDHFRLVIPSAKQDDSGNYAVEIINDAGKAKCDAQQIVEPIPEFIKPLQDLEVEEGQRAEFWCETNLRSVPRVVKWFKNGQEISQDDRIEIRVEANNGIFRLVIKSAVKDDIGTYKILLENTAGKAESQANLGVRSAKKLEPPKIVKALMDQIVAEGDELTFEVQVQGDVDEIKWLKDGFPLGKDARIKMEKIDDQTYRLTIPSAVLADAGEFEVQAINAAGKAVSSAHAEVDQAPRIVQGLVPAEIDEGDEHLFRVEASAPIRTVKWFKNGEEIKAPPGARIKLIDVSPKKYELLIDKAQLDDGATYRVVLANKAGQCESQADLKVRRPEVFKLRKGLEDVTIDEGQPLELVAELDGQPASVIWLKNGVEVVPDDRIKISANPETGVYSLKIPSAVAADGGAYRVVFANPKGGEVSSGSVAHVRAKKPAAETSPAIFLTPLEDVELPEGETLNLKCRVGGLPLPEVKWFRNGEEVKPDDRIAIRLGLDGTATLRIREVRKGEDASQFKAVATNEAGQAETQCQVTVKSAEELPSPPKFVIPLKRTEGIPGQKAEFNVKVRGVPMPTLEWILNGVPIDFAANPRFQLEDMSDGHWTMTIKDVQESDFGTLRCIARNEHGQDQCEAPFAPAAEPAEKKKAEPEGYPPRFNVPLWDRRVPEGPPMSIECHVDAKPTAEIEWFFKGQPLKESEEIEILNTSDGACRVRIRNFRKEHVGEYRCEAKNPYGVADTRANYNVEVEEPKEEEKKREFAPKFNPGLEDKQLNAGETLKLYCRVEAVPPASITFYKDGVPIRGTDRIQVDYDVDSGECHLTIADCTLDDAGAYRCVAQNVHGSTNTACQVGVKAKKEEAKKEGAEPFFTRGLVDQYVDRGATMVFTCAVTGDPEPEIKWFRNGLPLKPTNRISIEQLPGGECKLTIQDCSMTDEGIYRCEATNPLGTAKTQATGHVEVSKKLEKPKMEEGEPPRFIIPLEDCTLFVGSTIELECKVTGVPMPTVKWSKDGRPLLEDGRFEWENKPEQGHYRLRIREANRMDEGTYRCVATNDSGQASTKAFVKVDEGIEARAALADQARPPVISVKLADQRVMEGQPLKLHCRVEGDPTPELVWYKDGEQVRPSDRIQLERDDQGNAYLIIPKCTMDDDGVYRVIATNPHGSAYDKCTVTVKKAAADEGPIAPEGVEFDATRAPKLLEPLQNVKVNEKEPVKLRCRFGWRSGDPKPAIKWYKDGDRLFPYDHVEIPEITDDGYCDLSIPESVRSDAGNYRCVAENKFGSARTACEVQVVRDKKPKDLEEQLKEMGRAPGFTIPLTVKHAKPGDTVVFECLPYGKPFPDIKWLKDGVELVPGEGLKIEADPDGMQRLILDNVDFPAEGYYRCVATNEYGTASTRAELKLHGVREAPKRAADEDLGPQESKPRIRPGLYNQSIHQGSPVEMQIAALGYPTPTVEWLKDGKPITAAGGPDSKITIFQDDRGLHHLVIVNCQPEDEGDYSVVAKNPLGEAVSTGTLSVIRPREVEGVDDEGRGGMPFPPGFIRQLKNKHVFTKMPTIFDCLVVGYPPPEVDWYHNGKKITPGGRFKIQVAGGGSHALLITDTCVEDAGEYVAIARNCHGTAQSSAILDVTVPFLDKIKFDGTEDVTPYLTEEYGFKKQKYKSIPTPPDRGPFIKEVTGHYLTLSWIPTKRSPPRYPQVTYVIEFRELPNRDWQLLDYNIPEPVCKVRNLELGKSYQFRVRAENIYGISDPSPPSPPSRLMAPPPPVLDKFKRVIPILDPYAERALEMAHAEQYACTPWFAPGCQEKRFVAENDHTSISLHFNGYPDPKITWKHRGMDVDANSPTSNIRVSSHAGAETTITFLGFGRANVGQYTCVAENQYGKAEQNLLIEIATRPKFVQGLSNREFPSDRPLRLDVRIEGNPVPVVKWMKDWRPMAESSRIHFLQDDSQLRSLLIDQPIWSDSGIYSCVALNDAGQAVTSCTITIEAENDFLKDFKIREVRKAIKLERSPFKNIYDIAEAEEEEYSASDSVKNGSVQNGSIKNGV